MGISTSLSSFAVDLYHSGAAVFKKGVSYVSREAKDVFANHTAIGRRLKSGIVDARDSFKQGFTKFTQGENVDGYIQSIKSKSWGVTKTLYKDKKFTDALAEYAARRGVFNYTCEGKSHEKIFQELIEMSGVGPTKFAQIISSNNQIMSKIKTPELQAAIRNTRSHCSFSRNLSEAQKVVDKAFPNGGYVLEKELSAGSIGAAYLVKRPDGSTAVLKMLKNGVTKEQLDMEEKIFTRVVKEFSSTPEEYAKNKNMLQSWYKDWKEELNFSTEFANNKLLATGAKRYKVAAVTDLSKDGTCLVMDKANGIQMNKLVNILEDYKANPAEFATKYSKEIAENPWLANPEKVMKELPKTLLKTFDEQFLFLKKNGKTMMHGDPHTGNFFITADANGKLIPEFIDTGNCVARSASQIKEDIKFFSNYMVGNSEGVAKYFVDQCGYSRADKALVTSQIAKDIETYIFGKKQKITKFVDIQNSISEILKKHGLQMSAENATAMKAQMQFFTAVSEAGKLSGQSFDMATLLKDIPQAVFGMIKNGVNPWSALKDALKFAYYNQQRAVGTAYQFSIKDIDKYMTQDNKLDKVA